jgi:hypothetical protein
MGWNYWLIYYSNSIYPSYKNLFNDTLFEEKWKKDLSNPISGDIHYGEGIYTDGSIIYCRSHILWVQRDILSVDIGHPFKVWSFAFWRCFRTKTSGTLCSRYVSVDLWMRVGGATWSTKLKRFCESSAGAHKHPSFALLLLSPTLVERPARVGSTIIII